MQTFSRTEVQINCYNIHYQASPASETFCNFPATLENSGLEFSVNTTNIQRKNFTLVHGYCVDCPITQRKVISFENLATSTYASFIKIGQSLNTFRMYHYLGADPETGRYSYTDSHGNLH